MMGLLEGRAEAISGEFNSQNVANTLWAYATIATKPEQRMIRQLKRKEAISGELNSQDVANCTQTRFGRMRRWEKAGGADDGAAGAAGGGDIKGVQLA